MPILMGKSYGSGLARFSIYLNLGLI